MHFKVCVYIYREPLSSSSNVYDTLFSLFSKCSNYIQNNFVRDIYGYMGNFLVTLNFSANSRGALIYQTKQYTCARHDTSTRQVYASCCSPFSSNGNHWRLTELVVEDRNDGWVDACRTEDNNGSAMIIIQVASFFSLLIREIIQLASYCYQQLPRLAGMLQHTHACMQEYTYGPPGVWAGHGLDDVRDEADTT